MKEKKTLKKTGRTNERTNEQTKKRTNEQPGGALWEIRDKQIIQKKLEYLSRPKLN